MGLQFGNLPVRIRGIVYYGLSPLEQRAWAKSITHGIPNLLTRVMRPLSMMFPSAHLYQNSSILFIINSMHVYGLKQKEIFDN